MDFITEVALPNGSIVGLYIAIGLVLVAVIPLIIIIAIRKIGKKPVGDSEAVAWIILSSMIIFAIFWSVLYVVQEYKPQIATRYSIDKFQDWVLEEYRVEINEAQAEALLSNTVNSQNPITSDPVYITTFDGNDATALLFHEKDDWRLVIHDNVAVPAPSK